MKRRQWQYPVLAANDPEGLAAPLRDELQWHIELAVPVAVEYSLASQLGWVAFVDEPAAAVAVDELEWFQQLAGPRYARLNVQQPEAVVTDPATLDAPLRDEIQWLQQLSEPTRRIINVIEAGNIFVDEPPPVIDLDRVEWFVPLSHPVPLPLLARQQTIFDDPETLNDPLRDEIQWFAPFSEPVLPKHNLAQYVPNPEETEPFPPGFRWAKEGSVDKTWTGEAAVSDGWTKEGSTSHSWSKENAP